jgi:hypothetical protein
MVIEEIAAQFETAGSIREVKPHGGGHINDSYHMVAADPGSPGYLLQRINHYVFREVDLLMRNIARVTEHITKQMLAGGIPDIGRKALSIVPTKDGRPYFKDPEGNYWRIFNFIPDHVVFESTTDPALAFEGARMFGNFTGMLAGLDPALLGATIPDFHNMKWRLSNLEQSIVEDPKGRVKLVRDEIRYVESSAKLMLTIHDLGEKGAIPLRITHNDTKISNVLFDNDLKGLCVIDLDTVMPGYVHSDFGDGIRTFTNTGEEDDEDPGNVSMDLELYRAFAAGFLDSTREILNPAEMDSLVYAGILFPYMQAVRFLTDYIAGDVYYKTKHSEHNLVRTRAQLKLAQDGEAKLETCREMIRALAL